MKHSCVPLGGLVSISGGGTPSRNNNAYWGGNIPWATVKDLKDTTLSATQEKITAEGLSDSASNLIPAGSVIVATRMGLGKVAINTIDVTINQDLKAFSCCADLEPRYLLYFLLANASHLDSMGKGATVKGITLDVLKDLSVPLPPLPEQKRITAILDKADSIRRKRQEAVRLTEELLRSVFLDMFGDPVTNPKGWPKAKLSEVVKGKYGIKAGPFGSSLKKEDYTTSGYRIYGQEQVIAGRFDIGDYYIGERKFQQLKECEVAEGDLLVSLVGSFGKVLVVPSGIEPGIINPRLLKITPSRNLVTSIFLAAVIGNPSIQAAFGQMAHGGTMGILNVGLLKQLDVILPPLNLQHEFAKWLKIMKKLGDSLQFSVDSSGTLFCSLIQRAFMGKL